MALNKTETINTLRLIQQKMDHPYQRGIVDYAVDILNRASEIDKDHIEECLLNGSSNWCEYAEKYYSHKTDANIAKGLYNFNEPIQMYEKPTVIKGPYGMLAVISNPISWKEIQITAIKRACEMIVDVAPIATSYSIMKTALELCERVGSR